MVIPPSSPSDLFRIGFIFCHCPFFLVVPQGPGLGPIPMSQFGTISRQISRHNSSTTSSSASMVSATGTYRRAPASSSQFSVPQPHLNGGPTYPQNTSEFSSTLGTASGPESVLALNLHFKMPVSHYIRKQTPSSSV